jgi:biotin transport system substrate-specific component
MSTSRRAWTFMDAALVATEATARSTPLKLAATLFITVATAAAAQVSVPLPFTPVPFTFQPMVVLLGGAVLGPQLGMLSQLCYLAAGFAGLPVFAASPDLAQGAARLLGPTGGYLMAYPLAAMATGLLARRGFDRRYVTSVIAMATGLAIVFFGGITWLTLVAPGAGARSLQAALAIGFYPFVLADLVKICLAAAIMPVAWRLLGLENDEPQS